MEFGIGWLFFLVCYLMVFVALPAVMVAASTRVRRDEKALWTVAVLFTSWLGFLVFMAVTQETVRDDATRRQRRRAETSHLVRSISDNSGA